MQVEGRIDGSVEEWLVLWRSQPMDEAMWESTTSMHQVSYIQP